jgi:isopenicillin N synthase-like dioxygenase
MSLQQTSNFSAIPLFDFHEFTSDRAAFIRRLREACHQVGFFYIQNHGVSPALMQRILQLAAAFFDLPDHIKDTVLISQSPHFRGYGRLEGEVTKGLRDYKETFDLGPEQAPNLISADRAYRILQGPNQWPVSVTLQALNWKETLLEYMTAVQAAGKQLMQAMALTLELPENYFANKISETADDAYAILRLLRYPPAHTHDANGEPKMGVGAHTDAGCLVMLLQDNVGGLQVQNCNGDWIDAPPIEGTYVVNIGEMLQHWSNNYFLATPHRVINISSTIRHSAPFFLEPNLNTVVAPLDISDHLLSTMKRPKADANKSLVYGEHMLAVYERSFQP